MSSWGPRGGVRLGCCRPLRALNLTGARHVPGAPHAASLHFISLHSTNPVATRHPPPVTPQELVATKLELAELKELQLVTQRQLSRQASVARTSSMGARSAAGSLGGRSNSGNSNGGGD